MGTVVAVVTITPELVVGLIKLLRQCLKRINEEQNEIRQNLGTLKIDLSMMKDIAKIIEKNSLRNSDGVMVWMEEASRLVSDASALLQRIEDGNNRPPSWWQRLWRNQERFRCSRDDAKQLKELSRRCEDLTRHNETVLRLIEQHRRHCGCI